MIDEDGWRAHLFTDILPALAPLACRQLVRRAQPALDRPGFRQLDIAKVDVGDILIPGPHLLRDPFVDVVLDLYQEWSALIGLTDLKPPRVIDRVRNKDFVAGSDRCVVLYWQPIDPQAMPKLVVA